MYHNNYNNLEATFVKLSEKIHEFIYENFWCLHGKNSLMVMFCHCDRQKIEKMVSLLMIYEN